MKDNLNNIGDLFRNTLKDHHMDSDADLWNRLDSQLSAQPTVTAPKPVSVLHHLTWVKMAAAASVLVGVALAYNFIYLPLQQKETKPDATKIIEHTQPANIIDSGISQTGQNNVNESSVESVISQNDPKTSLNPTQVKPAQTNAVEKTNPANNNSTSNTIVTNNQSQTQPQTNNNTQNPNNNQNKAVAKKDSVIQPQTKVIDKAPVDTYQNAVAVHDNSQKDDVILNTDIPNVFTPNGDGFNDYFIIRNIEKCSSNHLVIKDRAGKIIFEKLNYQNDWNASNVADGVYFYFFKYNVSGNNFGKMGSIMIKR
ncbi:MAG: gliding motility-associated C-terminal domain-containing protein [Bacteroidetes bacterium]|nr:gliding motility-associated C-terminal domain-containing protein [Bacteroidota bacterium]